MLLDEKYEEYLAMLFRLVDSTNYKRACLYLTSCSKYVSEFMYSLILSRLNLWPLVMLGWKLADTFWLLTVRPMRPHFTLPLACTRSLGILQVLCGLCFWSTTTRWVNELCLWFDVRNSMALTSLSMSSSVVVRMWRWYLQKLQISPWSSNSHLW